MNAAVQEASGDLRSASAPPAPAPRLSIGVTGHFGDHPAVARNREAIDAVLGEILSLAAAGARAALGGGAAPPRLHCLLTDGVDQMAARRALDLGFELAAPLPFGRALNAAINARPRDAAEARAILSGDGALSEPTAARCAALQDLSSAARRFELAEKDAHVAALYLASLDAPDDFARRHAFLTICAERVALAGRVMIEQSDLILAVWDGETTSAVGGTFHTLVAALDQGAPVIWVDARAPHAWRCLRAPEALVLWAGAATSPVEETRDVERLLAEVLVPRSKGGHGAGGRRGADGVGRLAQERWPTRSFPLWHGYRRVEALFGGRGLRERFAGLGRTYEAPDAAAAGSGAAVLNAGRRLGLPADFIDALDRRVLRRFAFADGVSSHLSDCYRGGMIANFVLSALAVGGGLAWLPLEQGERKWMFECFEILWLALILVITFVGGRRAWHGRWFETRRVAEYFRHGPLLLLTGVARPPGRWPVGATTSWPEWYARQGLREVGLPETALTPAYLRSALAELLAPHVASQRDYHRAKAARLAAAHHNLDRLSGLLFVLAVTVVAGFLLTEAAAERDLMPHDALAPISRISSYLGVLLPTLGAAFAGIRYFGDFERFSAISAVSAEKLSALHERIELLLHASDAAMDYRRVSDLVHAADDIVVSEIENWQAVFSGKPITVPV